MEYALRQGSLKVSAATKAEAVSIFRTIGPSFQHISERDIVLVPNNTQMQNVYFLPKSPTEKAVYTSIPVVAWDCYKGVKYALIVNPQNEQLWVDQHSGIILGSNLTNAARRNYVKSMKKDRKQQMSAATKVSTIEFWRRYCS